MTTADYLYFLTDFISEKGLTRFYPALSPTLHDIAARADALVHNVHPHFVQTREIARDLSILSLYDIVLLLDDSGSMRVHEGGRRITALQTFVTRVAGIATHFDTDGIALRWLNTAKGRDGITQAADVSDVVSAHNFGGHTKLGTELWRKILDPLVVAPARAGTLMKPVMVVVITDGEPNKEPTSKLKRSILAAQSALRKAGYGESALAVQIARVGNSEQAKEFIHRLDVDPEIGGILDCVQEEGIERAEELLTLEPDDTDHVDVWLTKLLIGAVDSRYDVKNDSKMGDNN